jgi:hypothetical protein
MLISFVIIGIPAETLVHTDQGLKLIAEIKVGDTVLSFDEATQTTSYQSVTALRQNEQQYQMVKVTLASGQVVESTAEHPFYVQGKGWIQARFLTVGQELRLYSGQTIVLKKIDTTTRIEKVYNFTVANTSSYFVGVDGVLVHNSGCSKAVQKVLGNLVEHADELARNAILQRGGGGSQIQQIGHYADKTLREIAELIIQGDKGRDSADSALKIVKQALKKAQKYGGK